MRQIKKEKKFKNLLVQKVLTRKRDIEHQSIILQNVRDTGFQNKLIQEYLEETEHLTKEQLEVVTSINNDINDKLGKHNILSNSTWIPKRFEFSNMFSYGTNNVIDFTNMKGEIWNLCTKRKVVSQLYGTKYHSVCLTSVQEQSEEM